MSSSRSLLTSLSVYVALAATGAVSAEDTDFITGKGLPNLILWLCPTGGNSLLAETGVPQPVSTLTRSTGTSGLTSAAVRPVSAGVCR